MCYIIYQIGKLEDNNTLAANVYGWNGLGVTIPYASFSTIIREE